MRKLLFIASICFISFASCKNDKKAEKDDPKKETKDNNDEESPGRSIVGKWQPLDFVMKDKEEQLTPEEKKVMLESGFYVEFTSSGHYNSTFGDEPEKGTYTFNEKTNELRTVREGKNGQVDKVMVSWEGEVMVIEDEEGIMKMKRI
jgi:hypothetical protein